MFILFVLFSTFSNGAIIEKYTEDFENGSGGWTRGSILTNGIDGIQAKKRSPNTEISSHIFKLH